jgi:hypothetical protein
MILPLIPKRNLKNNHPESKIIISTEKTELKYFFNIDKLYNNLFYFS